MQIKISPSSHAAILLI